MDHAEVLERIESAVAAPGGLARLVADASPESLALRRHVASCPPCAAEWRAWSVVALGLAAAAPETIEPRPGLRDSVLTAAAARPRAAASRTGTPAAAAPPGLAAPSRAATSVSTPAPGPTTVGISLGPRRGRPPVTPVGGSVGGPPFRLILVAAAAAIALLTVGAVLGRGFLGGPGPSSEAPRGDPGRILTAAAEILSGGGFGLARLETSDGQPGGVVLVSPGSGRLAVVSSALAEPPDGARWECFLERDGSVTPVGYMRWESTAGGGSLAYWAGDASPPDLGLQGDRFLVALDTPGSPPVLTGDFLG